MSSALSYTIVIPILLLLLLSSLSLAYTPSTVSMWSTVPSDPSIRLSPQPPLSFSPSTCSSSSSSSLPTLSLTSTRLQPLVGFGASLTETTAYNFATLKARNASAYSDLLTRLFAPAPAGIAISYMRLPITSCDLIEPTGSVPWWTFDDTAGDVNLTAFDSSHAMRYQVPVLQDIYAVLRATGGQMRLVGAPWTAPTAIKDSQSWYAGRLLDEWYPWYASYLTKVALTFDSLGLPLYALSLQNEPTYVYDDYPCTYLSAQNESILANLLQPALRAAHLNTLVMAFDSDPHFATYPLEVMQAVGGDGQSVDAIGFHCYYGEVGNQTVFHNAYPNTLILATECSSFGPQLSTDDFVASFMRELPLVYFDNLNNWGSSAQHWSLAVDLNYGPHEGGCPDCSGTVTVDAANTSRPYFVSYNAQYYSIGHFASLIPPMSYRLASTLQGGSGLQSVVAVTPDGSVVVQLLNQNAVAMQVLVQDTEAGACFVATLPAMSMNSFKYATQGEGVGGSSGGLSAGAVAAIVVVVLLAVLGAAVGVWWAMRRRGSGGGGGGGERRQWQSYRDQGSDRRGMEMSLH